MVFGICNYICVVICVAEVTMFVFFCTSVDRLSTYMYNIVLSAMECLKVEERYLLFITCSGLL